MTSYLRRIALSLALLFISVLAGYAATYKVTYQYYGSVVLIEEYESGAEVNKPDVDKIEFGFPLQDGYEYVFSKKFPFTMRGNVTIQITEEPINNGIYNLILLIGKNDPIILSYESGKLINFTLPSSYNKEGYVLKWDKEYNVMPAEDYTLTATYVPIDSKITYNGIEEADNGENPAVYNIETCPVTLQEPKKEGYKFEGWFIGENKVTEIACKSGDVTLTAKWSENSALNDANASAKYSVIGNEIRFSDDVKFAELYNLLGVRVGVMKNGVIRVAYPGVYLLKVDETATKVKLSSR